MIRGLLLWTSALLAAVLLAVVLGYVALVRGLGGEYARPGEVTRVARPARAVQESADRQRAAAPVLRHAQARQILFGDLHVHTTFSSDAFLFSLPLIQGEGAHPPADACDFARFCAALDFWSINDHAELLTPAQWAETRSSIRQCNAVAGEAADPDLVAFLGWEWTQAARSAEEHVGHKNVVLRGIEDDEVPARPISAGISEVDAVARGPGWLRALLALGDLSKPAPYLDFNRFAAEASALEFCPPDVPVRDLPPDCLEAAETPEALFSKLDEWGFDALVIPHGTSWGIHAPPRASLSYQLGEASPRQRLFEVYSGHGSSERFVDFAHVVLDADGELSCPIPQPGFTPCCWRAGELVRARCDATDSAVCERRARQVRQRFAEAGKDPRRFFLVAGASPEEWGECGQLEGAFLPAYLYRPKMSAQYGLALGDFGGPGPPRRFRYGLVASSDNHKARAGSGYKELGRKAMGDAWGLRQSALDALLPETELGSEPLALEDVPFALMLGPERGASFYYTGGLVAVHSAGRDRDSIFDALERREVYGTSGDRILLWFDLLSPSGERRPMGGEVVQGETPHFEVRAVGALHQKPGCPDFAANALGPERLQRLCLGECYHPGDRRKQIQRIEVVRIRPQLRPDEPVDPLIEDPWRILECPPDPAGCRARFSDDEYAASSREAVYYVRAVQEPTPAVSGDPLRCERDAVGRCIRSRPCYASGPSFDPTDECLAPVAERAWSSPIFVAPPRPSAFAHGARTP